MNGQIFISYRRDDSAAWAGRLSDRLSTHFPSNRIFMDVDTIEPGIDFVEAIEESVGSCDVLIAVIGNRWLTSSDRVGGRRLEKPEDSVRLEIATALKRRIRVIPVLVDGATMPEVGDLPDDLKALVRRNAIKLSHDRFRTESELLASTVARVLEKAAPGRCEREAEDRLEAELPQGEGGEQQEHEPQSPPPPGPSGYSAKPEAAKPSAERSKAVYPLPSRSTEPKFRKPRLSWPGGIGGKSLSKQVVVSLAIATVLVVGGIIYLAIRSSQLTASRSARAASVTPGPTAIAAPTVEENAPSKSEMAIQKFVQPASPLNAFRNANPIPSAETSPARAASVTPGPTTIAAPTVEENAPSKSEMAIQKFVQPTSPLNAFRTANPTPQAQTSPTSTSSEQLLIASIDPPANSSPTDAQVWQISHNFPPSRILLNKRFISKDKKAEYAVTVVNVRGIQPNDPIPFPSVAKGERIDYDNNDLNSINIEGSDYTRYLTREYNSKYFTWTLWEYKRPRGSVIRYYHDPYTWFKKSLSIKETGQATAD